jgi:hypothetical protein
MHRVLRISGVVLMMLAYAGRSPAQSPDVTAAITATPNPVAPGGLLTVTLTLTNRGPATGKIFVGIEDARPALVVHTLAPPGLVLEHFPACYFWDCSDPFTGFVHSGCGSASSVSLSLVLQVDEAPGANITITGFAAKHPSDEFPRSASTTITVAGSGVPPSVPSMLLSDASPQRA